MPPERSPSVHGGRGRRLRILTWHVHGNYLWYLSRIPHDLWLATDPQRSPGHSGRSGSLPWPDNVHEAPCDEICRMPFDVVLYQSRPAWLHERQALLSAEQRRLPSIYLEHDTPQQHPTDTQHVVDDPDAMLVHVTPYNALMWDNGRTPVRVVEHGVAPVAADRWPAYTGARDAGIVVVNQLRKRGRRLGSDLVDEAIAAGVPLAVAGMESAGLPGGIGDVPQQALPALVAEHRFFFHPARWTSLGLAVLESMMTGTPVVGFATTELSTIVRSGENGWIDSRPQRLHEVMKMLLRDPGLARQWGEAGRRTALERFHIDRFVADWCAVLREVAA